MELEERYRIVKSNVGVTDVSQQYGRLFAKGKDAFDLLHRMSTNDITPLESGNRAVLTALLNEKGRFVDLVIVIKHSKDETLLVTSAGKEEAVIQWLDKFTIMEDARFERASEKIVQFFVCGPNALELLQKFTTGKIDGSRSEVCDLSFGTAPASLVKVLGLAMKGWFLLTSTDHAPKVREALLSEAERLGGAAFERDLFEILRIENGMPIAPNEINEKHNPLEIPGIGREAVSFTKGCYIGQEVIARLDAQDKVQRQLVGLCFADELPSPGDRISDESLVGTALGDEIGEVTSTVNSPQKGPIALGYVRGKYANPGRKISVKSANGNIMPATLVSLPFDD